MGLTTVSLPLSNRSLRTALAAAALIVFCGLPLRAAEPAPSPSDVDSSDADMQPPRDIPLPRAAIDQSAPVMDHAETDEPRAAHEQSEPEPDLATPHDPTPDSPPVAASVLQHSHPKHKSHDPLPETPRDTAPDEAASAPNAKYDEATEPTGFATTFLDLPPPAGVKIDAASFNGVQPGKTSAAELIQLWGDGKVTSEVGATEEVRSYKLDSFPRIDVTLVDETVKSIVVQLAKPVGTATLAKQLQIADVRPVNIPDDSGQLLGQAYPERGVLLTFAPGGKLASHISLEKIDLDSFVLRAEMFLDTQCRRSQADLDYVLHQQPQHARALYLRAKLYLSLARYDEALLASESAISIDENQPTYRLLRGQILGCLGKYDQAAQLTKEVLNSAGQDDLELKASSLCQLADLIADSPAHDYRLALDQHLAAIKAADQLAHDKNATIRRAAKLTLIDAHLGAAHDIAAGIFGQKPQIIPKWIDRATAFAEDMIKNESADAALRLHVDRGALAACAVAEGKIDPLPFTRQALQQGKQLIAAADDPWRKHRLEWELGLALSDGLTADQARGPSPHALDNATLTASYLEEGAKGRRENPEDVFRLGYMYYRVGALHAVRKNDHKTAVAWYEKALPLLDRPIPPTQHAQQGHYGEWLVSMGITYWEVGQRQIALDLTDAGMQHVEEAVHQNLIEAKALTVPYNNLAAMHQTLGHTTEARDFADMAAKLDHKDSKPTSTIQR